jgi:hypothetical protein
VSLAQAQTEPPLSLRILITEGNDAAYPVGSMPYKGFGVVVTDGEGHPVANAKVTFRLPAKEPGGVFLTGAATEEALTDKAGRASVWGIRWGGAAGICQVSITALSGQVSAGTIARVHLLAPGAAPEAKAKPADEVVEKPTPAATPKAAAPEPEGTRESAPPSHPVKSAPKSYEPSFEVSPAPARPKTAAPANPPEEVRLVEPAGEARADKRPGVMFSRTEGTNEHIPNPRMKWVWWTLGIAGAVGGGLAYRLTRNPQEAVQISGDITRPLSLGQPSISVGKP